MSSGHRKFLEDLFSHYSKGEIERYFACFDPHVQWTIHGAHTLAGSYKNLDEVKQVYARFCGLIKDQPKHWLRYLIVEGERAAAFLFDEVQGKDGRNYKVDYTFLLELSRDGRSIAKVDNFVDTHQLLNIIKASGKQRLVA